MKRAFSVVLLLAGCSAGPDDPGVMYMPEMVVSTAYDAHDRNPVLPHHMTLQPPPEGSVPQGFTPLHYSAGPEQAALAAEELESPFPSDEASVARGQVLFARFCAVCHGRNGDGDGTVVPPFPNPPSLHTDRLRSMADGQIFHIVTFGQNFMPPYAVQVHADDRWRIIHYVRSISGDPAAVAPDAAAPSAPDAVEPAVIDPAIADAGVAVEPAPEPAFAEPPAAAAEPALAIEPMPAEPSAPRPRRRAEAPVAPDAPAEPEPASP